MTAYHLEYRKSGGTWSKWPANFIRLSAARNLLRSNFKDDFKWRIVRSIISIVKPDEFK